MKNKNVVRTILIVVNILLIAIDILFSWFYSKNLKQVQTQNDIDTFCSTIESMKQVSDNYLRMERGYVSGWAQYIEHEGMTVDEALEYINNTNIQEDRYAHIVDMSTYKAYSTYYGDSTRMVECYKKFANNSEDETNNIFMTNMNHMFYKDEEFSVLGKYRTDDTHTNVVSVGTKVTLANDDGSTKDYLLLRIIPLESIRKIWVFPVEYMDAQVGIITKSGAYVVPSEAMKSVSFAEFILSYNYQDDYEGFWKFLHELSDTDKGLLKFKDSKGEDCYWYYSSFGESTGIDILGYIPVAKLETHTVNWTLVIVTCGVLALMVLLDGAYILQMNRELRRTALLAEAASNAKTNFLSTMSHDIRTPMNGIIGMTNIAKEHLDDKEYVAECLDKVTLASGHLLTLINDILDISKVESGKMALRAKPFSIERSINKLVDVVQVQIDNKHIKLDVEKDIPRKYLVADELRVNQIYINILSNAIKYTPDGGSINIKLKEQELPGSKVCLTYIVSDTGCGMSPEFQKNMYSMFTREVDSKVAKIQGTGLGLAIVKQIVDLMGGTINCESEVDKGTTFTVSVDVGYTDRRVYERTYGLDKDQSGKDFQGMNVLVAEDNDLNWEIIQEMLRTVHVTCDRAENGRQCVDMLEASKDGTYDLVLMDIQMPVMDGREATKLIRQSGRSYVRDIMIYAMTADAFIEDVQACINVGMNGHLAKPVDMSRVCEALRKASH